jgi:hypothetical protein
VGKRRIVAELVGMAAACAEGSDAVGAVVDEECGRVRAGRPEAFECDPAERGLVGDVLLPRGDDHREEAIEPQVRGDDVAENARVDGDDRPAARAAEFYEAAGYFSISTKLRKAVAPPF